MKNLFEARLVAYFRSPLLYIAAIISFLTGMYIGRDCDNHHTGELNSVFLEFEAPVLFLTLFVMMILISVCAGKQFSDGTIRNHIIAGHTRPRIFLAEALTAAVIAVIIFVIHITPTFFIADYFIKELPVRVFIKWTAVMLLVFEFVAIVTAAVSFLVAKRGLDLVITITLFIGMSMIASFTYNYYKKIDKPKEEYVTTTVYYEDGSTEEREVLRQNIYYTEGLSKALIRIEHAVNTMFSLSEIRDYEYIKDESQLYADEKNNTQRERQLDYNIIKMLIECIVICGAGAFLFRCKDLK